MDTGDKKTSTIEDLPDEVLEFILGFLLPYKDLQECMQVSKRWNISALNVLKSKDRNLHKAIADFDIQWETITPPNLAPTITKRYSHSAVVHENTMYVFGGCTCSMTTFNDLWRLDLSQRRWIRPLTMGTYPSPKACSSMVCYKDLLVLFGGWTHPPSYPLHQSWNLFNELHTYNITTNRWTCIHPEVSPPPTAGHSVSVHKHFMVVFGGLQRSSQAVHSTKSNDVWKLNLETWQWTYQEITGHTKPQERYGQSQTVLDDENVLIMGGSGGSSINFSDVWVLNMKGTHWKWIPVKIHNKENAPMNLWCNPVCKLGDKVIVLSKSRSTTHGPPYMFVSKNLWVPPVGNPAAEAQNAPQRIDMAARAVDRDENINGKRGTLKGVKRNNNQELDEEAGPSVAGPSHPNINPQQEMRPMMAAFKGIPKSDAKKQLRHSRLKQVEKLYMAKNAKTKEAESIKVKRRGMSMYVLDISHALDVEPYVSWLPCEKDHSQNDGPDETVLYTLVGGNSELIMFGGIQKDANDLVICTSSLSNQVSNSVHFITAPSYVI